MFNLTFVYFLINRITSAGGRFHAHHWHQYGFRSSDGKLRSIPDTPTTQHSLLPTTPSLRTLWCYFWRKFLLFPSLVPRWLLFEKFLRAYPDSPSLCRTLHQTSTSGSCGKTIGFRLRLAVRSPTWWWAPRWHKKSGYRIRFLPMKNWPPFTLQPHRTLFYG